MIKIKIKIGSDIKNLLPGGSGDYTDPDSLDQEELFLGSKEEMEHTNNPEKAFEISVDHLTDNPSYYTQLKKSGLTDDKPLSKIKSNKLSKYWKKRAKRRALKAGRKPRNGIDRKWALDQQEKSSKINNTIKKVFKNTLEMTEEIEGTIKEIMKRMKEQKAKFQKTTPKDLQHRPKPSKIPKQKKGEQNPITGKIRRTRHGVAVGAGFGGAAGTLEE